MISLFIIAQFIVGYDTQTTLHAASITSIHASCGYNVV